MAEVDGVARARLLEALRVHGATVRRASLVAGYSRASVYRMAEGDAEVAAALEALQGVPGKGRRARLDARSPVTTAEQGAETSLEARPQAGQQVPGATPALPAPLPSGALGLTAPEAATYRRRAAATLAELMDDDSLDAPHRIAAAKGLVSVLPPASALVKAPEPPTLRAKVQDADGRSAEVEGSGTGIEGLISRVLGGGKAAP